MRPLNGTRRTTAWANVLLPQPDSPTRPTVSRRWTESDTPSTAVTLAPARRASPLHRERDAEVLDIEHPTASSRAWLDVARFQQARVPAAPSARGSGCRSGSGRARGGQRARTCSRPARRAAPAADPRSPPGAPCGRRRAWGCCAAGRRCTGEPARGTAARVGADSTTRPPYITLRRRAHVGDDAEIVGDQQQRHPWSAISRREQVEDLRLHGDVEGGRRLVGDQQRAGCRRWRWRSSPVGASRRRTGAGTARRGGRGRGCRPRRAARRPAARRRRARQVGVRLEDLARPARRPSSPG